MRRLSTRRTWAILTLVGLVLPCALGIMLIGALDTGLLRGPVIAYVQSHFDRPIRIDGPLQMRLWSAHPRIVAQQVSIGNPPWVEPGEFARIGRLTLVYDAPGFGHGAVLQSVALEGATLHMQRDEAGHANWQRFDPDSGQQGKGMPLIRELSADETHLLLDDRRRHLRFDGTLSTSGSQHAGEPSRLHIVANGELNGRQASIDFSGDALERVSRQMPYAFEFVARSSGSRLQLHGSLPQPFDFTLVDATFEAAGADLKDLYFLTGVSLVNTGAYRVSGSIAGRGGDTCFDELRLTTGLSDVGGNVSSSTSRGRSLIEVTLSAGALHAQDFGGRAAGREPPALTPPRVFSDVGLNAEALRRTDALVHFDAQRVDAGRFSLQSLSGQMKIDHGLVTVAGRGDLMQGRFEARGQLNANQSVPAVKVDMVFDDVQLASLGRKPGEAPLEGLLHVRTELSGRGSSLHEVAASATGSITATLHDGKIRVSLAELTGVDLRGLGLTLTRSKREAEIRCAAVTFEARDGTLTTNSLFIDTVPVLIKGAGVIHLGNESLDIALHGEPKDVRLLRIDAPVLIHGSLARPTFAIQTRNAAIALIDPGHGKDADCSSVLASPVQ